MCLELASRTQDFQQMEPVSFTELRELRMTELFIFPEEGQFSSSSASLMHSICELIRSASYDKS